MTTKVTVTAKGGDVVATSIMGSERTQSVVKKGEEASFPVHNTLDLEVKALTAAKGSTVKIEATNWPVSVQMDAGEPVIVDKGGDLTVTFDQSGTLSVRETQAVPEAE